MSDTRTPSTTDEGMGMSTGVPDEGPSLSSSSLEHDTAENPNATVRMG